MTSFYRYPTNEADHQLADQLTDLIIHNEQVGMAWARVPMVAQLLAQHRGQKGLLVTKEKPTACDTYKWRRCE